MNKEARGRKKLPYKCYRKRYPEPLKKEIDAMVKEWKKDMGYV